MCNIFVTLKNIFSHVSYDSTSIEIRDSVQGSTFTSIENRGHVKGYLEWPHRQGGCLACWSWKVDPSCGWDWTDLYYASGGTAHEGGLCDQSGSTISDAIVRSWLWSTATRSSPPGYFSRLLQVVDNWPHIMC